MIGLFRNNLPSGTAAPDAAAERPSHRQSATINNSMHLISHIHHARGAQHRCSSILSTVHSAQGTSCLEQFPQWRWCGCKYVPTHLTPDPFRLKQKVKSTRTLTVCGAAYYAVDPETPYNLYGVFRLLDIIHCEASESTSPGLLVSELAQAVSFRPNIRNLSLSPSLSHSGLLLAARLLVYLLTYYRQSR